MQSNKIFIHLNSLFVGENILFSIPNEMRKIIIIHQKYTKISRISLLFNYVYVHFPRITFNTILKYTGTANNSHDSISSYFVQTFKLTSIQIKYIFHSFDSCVYTILIEERLCIQ